MFVKDLHSKNYGINGDGNLSIVDFQANEFDIGIFVINYLFQIKTYVDPTMVRKYLDEYKSWKGSKELRIRVGKDCINSWNFPDVFDEAVAGIAKQKDLFKKHSISYQPSRSLDEYLIRIKKNVEMLSMLFE